MSPDDAGIPQRDLMSFDWPVAAIAGLFCLLVSLLSPSSGFVLFAFSLTLSRLKYPVGDLTLLPEHLVFVPVAVGLAVRTLMDPRVRRPASLPVVPFAFWLSAILAVYVLLNFVSSMLMAVSVGASLRIVAWMVYALCVYIYAYAALRLWVRNGRGTVVLLAVGFASAVIALLLYALAASGVTTFGVQPNPGYSGGAFSFKVAGTFFEANILGSFQAAILTLGFSLGVFGSFALRVRLLLLAGTAVSALALFLSLTRAAWVGALVGLLVVLLLYGHLAYRETRRSFVPPLRRFVAVLLIVLGVGVGMAFLADDGVRRQAFATDTWHYRLQRYEAALQETRESPLFGHGTNSYGQRHLDPSTGYAADYLPGLGIATLYDTGVVGLTSLVAVGVLLIRGLIVSARRVRNPLERATRLGLLGAAMALAVSYQFTNAFWFGFNWLALALVVVLYESSLPEGGVDGPLEGVRS